PDLINLGTEFPVQYGGGAGPVPLGTLPAGSFVTSHFLHFNTVGMDQATLMGQITFESDILAVIVDGVFLNWTDDEDPSNGAKLGSDTVNYPTDPRRAWELGAESFFRISEDFRTITVRARVNNFLDQTRVITEAAPPNIQDQPYVSANNFILGADEVTLDNCSSAWYKFEFELPPNFENASISGFANVDDVGVVFLNGNQISASVTAGDLNVDRVDNQGRAILSWPTLDAFSTNDQSHFTTNTNELVFGVIGDLSRFEPTGVEFNASVVFDEADFVIGDVNGDGEVNLLDVAPFVDTLATGGFLPAADINEDGEVNLLDVAPFVDLLSGG
ncbi:MAG: dockerin type I repeat-containing protein, partial [Planctomycetota bacterium]